MNRLMRSEQVLWACLGVALLSGCQGSLGGGRRASGGEDESLSPEGSRVTLKAPEIGLKAGEGSYQWSQVGGPAVELDDPNSPSPSFAGPEVDEETELDFVVAIEMGGVTTAYEVGVLVPPSTMALGNRPPVAVAGEFKIHRVGETVVLNAGNSHDPDHDPLTYAWRQVDMLLGQGAVAAAAPRVRLFNANQQSAGFDAEVAGTFLFEVRVSDGQYTVSHTMAVAVLPGPGGGLCANVACLPGLVCAPDTGECVPVLPPCADEDCCTDVDCDDDDACTVDECIDGLCSSSTVLCEEGSFCDPETGECVASSGTCDEPYAQEVLEYNPAYSGGAHPLWEQFTDPAEALGPQDYTGGNSGYGSVSIGQGGILSLGFGECLLVNSGDDKPDLRIYEIGPAVEGSLVSLRPTPTTAAKLEPWMVPDDDGYLELGYIGGSTQSVDLDAYLGDFEAGELQFDAIRLIDDPNTGPANPETPGADIDAIEILYGAADEAGSSPNEGGECTSDVDCDDGDPCTHDECRFGACESTALECPPDQVCVDGTCIDDGNEEEPCPPAAEPWLCDRLIFTSSAIDSATGSGSRSRGVAIADVSGDCLPDLIVANYGWHASGRAGSGSVVLQSEGDDVVLSAGNGESGVAVGDLDADGLPEIVVSNAKETCIFIFSSWGDGTYQGPTVIDVGSGSLAVALADLDGDSALDIAVPSAWDGTATVLINSGTGTFPTKRKLDVGHLPDDLAVADVDGDGDLDLLVANDSITLMRNTGNDSFLPPVTVTPIGVGAAVALATGDFDGDNLVDVVTAEDSPDRLAVFFGDGRGEFPDRILINVADEPLGVLAVDLNGDGLDDIASASDRGKTVTLLESNGDRSFTITELPATAGAFALAAADIGFDGDTDLMVATNDATITALENVCADGPEINQRRAASPSADRPPSPAAWQLQFASR